jgi:hypothetical protein
MRAASGSPRTQRPPQLLTYVRLIAMELVPKPAKPVSNVSLSPITVLKGCVEGHCGGDLCCFSLRELPVPRWSWDMGHRQVWER